MNVEIDDGNPFNTILSMGMCGADRYIVEEAKSHCSVRLSVMSWWSDCAKSAFSDALHYGVDGCTNGAGGTKRSFS
jgi:hypothetical protein